MSRADTIQTGLPKAISELTKLRDRFNRGGAIKSGELAPAVSAVEDTYNRLKNLMRQKANEEWDAKERGGR